MFTLKKRTDSDTEELLREQNNWFCSSVRRLLFLLKEFALDASDLDVDAFRKRIDRLVQLAERGESAADWNRALDADDSYLLDHIDREKKYLQAREAELRGVIEFMRESLMQVVGEDSRFAGAMHEHNNKMERIASLDDIRKIKDALKEEMSRMRQAILEKERSDERRVESLAREVGSLRSDLESARQESMTDQLTGASNRLSFDSHIARRLERYVLSGERFSLLMCDLDDFKRVNDTYGHQAGDEALRVFVRECRSMIRSTDLLARYGGEEFAIVLPEATLRHAVKKAQMLCTRISSNRYLAESQDASGLLYLTTSIGVAEVRPNDSVATLVERADKALYTAKRTGKNKAVGENSLGKDYPEQKAA